MVILGTGGTIAGTADSATDSVGYRAASLGVEALVAAVPPLAGWPIECLQMAQLDSKDMTLATVAGAGRGACSSSCSAPEVGGVVITHGTDTLEETAYFLHRMLAPAKPVVLTAAMRPATLVAGRRPAEPARRGDAGAQPARWTACWPCWAGRCTPRWTCASSTAGGSMPSALATPACWRCCRTACCSAFASLHEPAAHPAAAAMPADAAAWPTVEIVTSHAGASGTAIDALVAAGAQGIVIAGTGNGSVHQSLLQAARRASDAGVPVVRASRCLLGGVFGAPADALPSYGALTPWQARIELMLDLLIRPR